MFEFKENVMFDNLSEERKKAFSRLGLKKGDNITEIFKNLLKEENRTLEYYFSDNTVDNKTIEKEINISPYFDISEKLLETFSNFMSDNQQKTIEIISKRIKFSEDDSESTTAFFEKEISRFEQDKIISNLFRTNDVKRSVHSSNCNLAGKGVMGYA